MLLVEGEGQIENSGDTAFVPQILHFPWLFFRSCQRLCLDKVGSPPRNFRMAPLQPSRSLMIK